MLTARGVRLNTREHLLSISTRETSASHHLSLSLSHPHTHTHTIQQRVFHGHFICSDARAGTQRCRMDAMKERAGGKKTREAKAHVQRNCNSIRIFKWTSRRWTIL